ncbi:MAG: LemA family protein [Candidatus Latescibacter sp.]|nr:LemA family protein [Candidatus Latescibacter sp.]
MKKALIIVAVILGVILIFALSTAAWLRTTYNQMVVIQEQVNGSWAQVQTVLQRRYDLIPNLVETVKGYASHEERVLTAVTEARAKVGGAATPADRMKAEGDLSNALSRLMVVVEAYPNLKANQNFIALQDQLEGTENRIAVERQRYNDTVRSYNQYIRQFPQNMIAGMFGFERKPFFEAPGAAQEAPKVQFK